LRTSLYNKVYKRFSSDKTNYDKGSSKKEVLLKLSSLEKTDLTEYDKTYDEGLVIIRDTLTKVFEKNVKTTVDYLNTAIGGTTGGVPLLVVKAYGTSYKILTDEDDVVSFLPKVKKIKSYGSTTSKQDFYKEAVEKGMPNPDEYANVHASIMFLAGFVSPRLDVLKKIVGIESEAGVLLNGICGGSETNFTDYVGNLFNTDPKDPKNPNTKDAVNQLHKLLKEINLQSE
jgi:hypothetical protein